MTRVLMIGVRCVQKRDNTDENHDMERVVSVYKLLILLILIQFEEKTH